MSATPIGSEFRVNTTITVGNQFDSAIALDEDGDFVVTWYSLQGTGDHRVIAQRYDSQGLRQGPDFTIDLEQNNGGGGALGAPDIATDAVGNFTVVWQNKDDDNDAFDGDGDGFGVIGQRYTSGGSSSGNNVLVNTSTVGDQDQPAIAMTSDGDYVVTWHSVTPDVFGNLEHRIYAQRYSETGTRVGSQISVASLTATNTTSRLDKPDVAIAEDGSFVITWESRRTNDPGDSSGFAVYAQRFSATGSALGSNFRVNSYTTSDQNRPAIAMDDDGNFVIAWESTGQDGNDDGVFARRYDKTGTAVDKKEFQVNVFNNDNQWGPDVAMDDDGNILVTWSSEGQDGSGYGVYARTYTNTGNASNEFRVNTFTQGDQFDPAVALNNKGNAVISWTSAGQDGSQYGVYAQRFSLAGGPTNGDDVLVGTDGDDIISGLAGNDKISGRNGNDTLNGNQGNDVLSGGNGRDKLSGATGRDELFGDSGNDRLDGGDGNDILLGGDENDTLFGQDSDDVLEGGRGNDILNGGKGNNTLFGDVGLDRFTIVVGGFAEILDFKDGKDSLGLAGNLQYRDLDISGRRGSTIIEANGVRLAQLNGVDNSLISKADFNL